MNLPVEVVELVINHFLKLSESDRASYYSALKTVSLISSFYLELSRRIKFKDLIILGAQVYFGVLKFRLKVQAHHLEPVTRRTRSNPLSFHLADYVKHLTLLYNENAFNSFIRIIGIQTVYIESIEIDCSGRDPLDLLSNLELGRFPRLDRIKFTSIYISSFNQCAATVKQLNPNIKLELDCFLDRSPPIEHPLHALRVTIDRGFSLSCFEPCLESLRKLDLNVEDPACNCDSFISSAINLQELTLRLSEFTRASLIATLHVICKLKDIRTVSLVLAKPVVWSTLHSINFIFKDQILVGIDVKLRELKIEVCEFTTLIHDLVVAKSEMIKEIFGQNINVDIRCFLNGVNIRRVSMAEKLVLLYTGMLMARLKYSTRSLRKGGQEY